MEIEEDSEGCWVWLSFAPEHRLLLAHVEGPRNHESADLLIERTHRQLFGDDEDVCLPLFVSDGLSLYPTALLKRYHWLHHFAPTGRRGRPRNPVMLLRPGLRYAQVIKEQGGGRVVGVTKRIVFGREEGISMKDVSTSLIERQNLNFRQENRRLTRRTLGFSKRKRDLSSQVSLYVGYFNFVRPHARWCSKFDENEAERDSPRKKRMRTPAMAAGLVDHRMTLHEFLTFPYYKTSVN